MNKIIFASLVSLVSVVLFSVSANAQTSRRGGPRVNQMHLFPGESVSLIPMERVNVVCEEAYGPFELALCKMTQASSPYGGIVYTISAGTDVISSGHRHSDAMLLIDEYRKKGLCR